MSETSPLLADPVQIKGSRHNPSRMQALRALDPGDPLTLVREPGNPFDPNAIMFVTATGRMVGYVDKELAKTLAPLIDAGQKFTVVLHAVNYLGVERTDVTARITPG